MKVKDLGKKVKVTTSISRICPAMRKQTPTGARWMIQVVTCRFFVMIMIIIMVIIVMIMIINMAIVIIESS